MSFETVGLVMGLLATMTGLAVALIGALLNGVGALIDEAILTFTALLAPTGFFAGTALTWALATILAGATFATGLDEALMALLGLVAVFLEFLFSGMSVGSLG